MLDLEDRIGRVRNPDVRPLVAEAHRCYTSGAARGCIVLTWAAVCADLIEKVYRLAEDNEGTAKAFATQIDQARSKGDDAAAIRLMQDVERDLLAKAETLEIIDAVERRQLERIREDRHLCAHPSIRPLGTFFTPSVEYARAHLVAALEALLVHPASQGRRVVDRFSAHVIDPLFSGDVGYLTDYFYARVKPATRRQIINLAAKHAVLEIDAPEPMQASELADRMALCIRAFAQQDRVTVTEEMKKVVDRLSERGAAVHKRALGRLGSLDLFWEAGGTSLETLCSGVINAITLPTDQWDTMDPGDQRIVSLIAVDEVRTRYPRLQQLLEKLSVYMTAQIISHNPSAYFVPMLPGLLRGAPGWRFAETITRDGVLPCAQWIDKTSLGEILTSWAGNDQSRAAAAMPDLAVDLYRATSHLHPYDHDVWTAFLQNVRSKEPSQPHYWYSGVAALIS